MISDSYLRKSTADAGKSVTRQEDDWRADCAAEGFESGRPFVDPDLSASRYARKARPSYAELVTHISTGRCEMLSMWEASRGARNMAEWVGLLDLCRKHGTLIRIFGGDPETFDPRKQRDREHLLNDGVASERESEAIATRVRAGARSLAYAGKPPGPLLFGYTRTYDERGKFVAQHIHPERAALVRRLAEDTLSGRSLNSLAIELNDAGVSSPLGGRWSGHGIARMLLNPGYAGKRVHQGEVIADAVWPAMFTDKQARELRALLTTPGRRHHQDSSLAWMLSGAARCYKCRRPLRTGTAYGKRKYNCITRGCMAVAALIADVDAAVTVIVLGRLGSADAREAMFAPRTDDAALQVARDELDALQADLREYRKLAMARKITPASFAEFEADLVPRIGAAETKVNRLQMPPALAEFADVDIVAKWPDFTPAVRREFVMAVADIVLGPALGNRKWSDARLGESRWVGDERTWAEIWATRQI